MSDSDAEFVELMRVRGAWAPDSDIDRLFALARRGAEMQWRPIEEAPKDGTKLLLSYRNAQQMRRTVKAFYAPPLAIVQNEESDWFEYDEANDRYCLPEGWYECIENWEEYSSVHMGGIVPTNWMPLPAPPASLGEQSDDR